MVGPGKLTSNSFLILRWVARIIGSLAALLIAFIVIAHFAGGEESPPPPLVTVGFALLVIGVILAWFWEGIGGGLLLLSSIVFIVLKPNAFWPPAPLIIFPIVAIIFIVCWLKSRSKPEILD